MTKEEIIHKGIEFSQKKNFNVAGDSYRSGLGFGYSCGYEDGLATAKQEAIGFAEWIDKEDYKTGAGNKVWYKWDGMDCVEVPYTADQLYQIYQTQKPKTNG